MTLKINIFHRKNPLDCEESEEDCPTIRFVTFSYEFLMLSDPLGCYFPPANVQFLERLI